MDWGARFAIVHWRADLTTTARMTLVERPIEVAPQMASSGPQDLLRPSCQRPTPGSSRREAPARASRFSRQRSSVRRSRGEREHDASRRTLAEGGRVALPAAAAEWRSANTLAINLAPRKIKLIFVSLSHPHLNSKLEQPFAGPRPLLRLSFKFSYHQMAHS